MRRSARSAIDMGKLLTLLVGGIFGFVGGALAGHLLVGLATDRVEKAVAGGFAGAMCGLVGGSLGGDLSGDTLKGTSRNSYGLIAGGLVGAFGAAEADALLAGLQVLIYGLFR